MATSDEAGENRGLLEADIEARLGQIVSQFGSQMLAEQNQRQQLADRVNVLEGRVGELEFLQREAASQAPPATHK